MAQSTLTLLAIEIPNNRLAVIANDGPLLTVYDDC